MAERLTVAVIGCGSFARNFVPLFKVHPTVDKVYVCDLIPEKAQEYADLFDVEIVPTFEDVLASKEINTVAIFAQRHLHGELVIRALKAGKHTYSAVPMGITVDECREIIAAQEETGATYMMGETCIYYPCSMYCKEAYERGDFGNFVYGEAQYFHDLLHFKEEYRNDPAGGGAPPFFYPTHSTAMLLNALGESVVRVTGMGYKDKEEVSHFGRGKNPWDNEFSDEFALMELTNGGIIRISECRRIGYKAPSSYISGFYGTQGAYQYANAQHTQTSLTETGVVLKDVSDRVNPTAMTEAKAEMNGDEHFKHLVANHRWAWSNNYAPVQEERRQAMPESFHDDTLHNGHMASHKFLIDDFCTAAANGTKPPVDARTAARFTVPGLLAHESAVKGGMPIEVPEDLR